MKRTLRLAVFAALLSAAALLAANVNNSPAGGLTVHEWGTFTSVAGVEGSAIGWDALACKDDLPRFVNEFGFRGFKFRLQGNVRMETPVIYLYSAREMEARVRVAFRHGVITEWYPRAEPQIDQLSRADNSVHRLPANLNGIDTTLRTLTGAIEWPTITVQPGTTPALPVESLPSRYYAARGTDAPPLAVGDQHEKFLFYRGVGRITVPLTARISGDGTIAITNVGPDPVPVVMLFENRAGRVGFRSLGSREKSAALAPPSLDSSVRQLQSELENALIAQGLFPKEAQAMLATWQDSWFEEGSRLIYIVPSRTLAEVLPLQVDPAPAQTARVFVGRVELITAETRRDVESAITRGDRRALEPYARFLGPILQRIIYEDPAKRNLAPGNAGVCP
jgi:hypothetical protein